MSEPEALAYLLLKGLYVCGIVCGLTPPFLLIAVLFYERRLANAHAVSKSEPHALRVPVGASVPQIK
jgi:hypothetical protein